MILVLILAGILSRQPVDHVYVYGSGLFVYSIGNTEWDCPDAQVSITGDEATVVVQECNLGIFNNGFQP